MFELWIWGLVALVLIGVGFLIGPGGRPTGLSLLSALLSGAVLEYLPSSAHLGGLWAVALGVGLLGLQLGLSAVPVAIPITMSLPFLSLMGNVAPAFDSVAMLSTIGVAAGALAWVLTKLGKLKDPAQGLAVGLCVGGGLAFGLQQAAQGPLLLCLGIGAVAALATTWATKEDGSNTRVLLAAAVWVAAGAVAFSTAREHGMAATLATGLLIAGLTGGAAAVHAAGGLLGLVAVQTFRLDQKEARLALDFSHHHALLGLILGVLLVVGLSELIEMGPRRIAVAAVGGLFVLVAGALVPVLTGPRAVTGLLIGAGLGPIVVALSQPKSQSGWVGAGLLTIVGFGVVPRIMGSIDLTRADKMQWLVGGVLLLALLGGALLALTKPQGRQSEEAHA